MKLPASTLQNYRNSEYYFVCQACKNEFIDLNYIKERKFCSAQCRKRIMPPDERIRRSTIAKEKGYGKWMLGKHHSQETREKISKIFKGKYIGRHLSPSTEFKNGTAHPNWKEDGLTYSGIHSWLRSAFGRANQCEFCHTLKAKQYDWSKLKYKKYEKKRENFWQLCKSCHIKYDRWDYKLEHGI